MPRLWMEKLTIPFGIWGECNFYCDDMIWDMLLRRILVSFNYFCLAYIMILCSVEV